MAHDYEDIHNIDELDDRELRDLVREQLAEQPTLDIDDITVLVAAGQVTLSGRVGTEGERRIAEHVLTDVLGIMDFLNDLVIDPVRRAESPMAIDEHLVDEEKRSGALLGDVAVPFSPEAEHLADEFRDDLAGTTDYTRVMEDGMTWNPPDSPTPEGIAGAEARPENLGEEH
ncbi:MAG: BON domain-containing protein [bacterium]